MQCVGSPIVFYPRSCWRFKDTGVGYTKTYIVSVQIDSSFEAVCLKGSKIVGIWCNQLLYVVVMLQWHIQITHHMCSRRWMGVSQGYYQVSNFQPKVRMRRNYEGTGNLQSKNWVIIQTKFIYSISFDPNFPIHFVYIG